MKGYIYKIVNTVNNKFYLGSTNNYKIRFRKHKYDLKNQKHVNKHLQNAWNKYGEEVFNFEIIGTFENLKETEQEFLDNLDFNKVYNISPNANGGDIIKTFPKYKQKEIYKKIANASKGRKPGNSIKINIEGTEYSSYNEAFRILNIPVVTIRYRCLSKNIKYKHWNIVGKEKTYFVKEGDSQGHRIICENKEFPSYAEAARYYNMSITAIQNRVKSKNYPDFFKLNA